jgi:hypothetical protein
MAFFVTAPCALVAVGVLLAWEPTALVGTRYAGPTLAVVHLLTLGWLAMVMLGALYQMIPVVAGAPVPFIRLAHLVWLLLAAGAGALTVGLLLGLPPSLLGAVHTLSAAATLFLLPAGWALLRAPTGGPTVIGMRLALAGLASVVVLGALLAIGRATGGLGGDALASLSAHGAIGLLVWVGGLIVAVSWQVVPMFYLAAPVGLLTQAATLLLVGMTLVSPLFLLLFGADARAVLLAAAPGAAAVWLLHPWTLLERIATRRRKRADASLDFWWAGLLAAPLALAASVAGLVLPHPRWVMLAGWLILVGWAGLIVHGMLTRIVPFLVWFHRCSPLVGQPGVPSMKKLLPDRRARVGLVLQLAALGAGAAAILLDAPALARAAGVALAGAGLTLAGNVLLALRHPVPPRLPPPTP